MSDRVLILDFGSQTTQLIARRVRELEVYCEIVPCTAPLERIRAFNPSALILSGGPASVHDKESPRPDRGIWQLGVPVLGICYGMQVMVEDDGGSVQPASHREFGRAPIHVDRQGGLFSGLPADLDVWMSHGDQVKVLPAGFQVAASSKTCPYAAIYDETRSFIGVQFHPEVVHTKDGKHMLARFLFDVAKLAPSWKMGSFADEKVAEIKKLVGDSKVVMALSGGVDSSVAAVLIHRAIGAQLTSVYVDHGLHRKGEMEQVRALFKDELRMDVRIVDSSDRFFAALEGVSEPEEKRKRIGHVFIDVFDDVARELGAGARFLGQGTLYPDVIESVSFHGGPSAVIKSHHNVGGLPERMKLSLIEPLRELFKDEVRALGTALGLPPAVVGRQPFPGPGLAIRVLGEVTRHRCDLLRDADLIVRDEIEAAMKSGAVQGPLWQWFAVLLPVRSVGVMGDARTYDETVCVRCVRSTDGMTADWVDLPHSVLAKISNRVINEVRGINRVVYDVSSKPPATIEWE
jgi:GMP synthase (glutamine-hydrolysing)